MSDRTAVNTSGHECCGLQLSVSLKEKVAVSPKQAKKSPSVARRVAGNSNIELHVVPICTGQAIRQVSGRVS